MASALVVVPSSGAGPAGLAYGSAPSDTLSPSYTNRSSPPGEKSRAFLLSLGGTVLPVAAAFLIGGASDASENQGLVATLFLGGALLGPSTGQFYARSPGLGLLGTGIRTVGGVLIATAMGEALHNMYGQECHLDPQTDMSVCVEKKSDEGTTGLIGLLVYAGGAVFSLAAIPGAVERRHRRDRKQAAFGFAPTLARQAEGGFRPGAMAWLRF